MALKLLEGLGMKTSTLIAVAAALGLSSGAAQAALITGTVSITGVALLNNANPSLATQVSISSASVPYADFDLTPMVGNAVTLTSPLVNGVTSGLLWQGSGFTFTTTGAIAFAGQNAQGLQITANGILDDGAGPFSPTPATFVLSVTRINGSVAAYGSVTTADPSNDVPDAGNALLFLGLGLVGVGVSRRLAV